MGGEERKPFVFTPRPEICELAGLFW